jgi:uncharacterized membrane protein
MFFKGAVVVLCGVGLYASAFMLGKARRAARGELREPSVVQTARARVLGGKPNAALGLVYYALLAAVTPALGTSYVWLAAITASLVAAAFSLYLAYSLLFVTRMPCIYCWTSHVVNWLVPLLLFGTRPQ